MDKTIQNVSQLEQALKILNMEKSQLSTPLSPNMYTKDTKPINNIENTSKSQIDAQQNMQFDVYKQQHNGTTRTSSSNMSTSGLLHNLSGLQTTNNTKIDNLTDAIFLLNNSIEKMYKEQAKQTELLTMIARNTVNAQTFSQSSSSPSLVNKSQLTKIRDYGIINSASLMSELILKLIKQAEIQIIGKNRQYKSTRDIKLNTVTQVVKIAADNTFVIDGVSEGPLKLPESKNSSTLKVASKIGSIEGTNPVLTPEAFREVFEDVDCRIFANMVEKIIERLCILRVLIPYYEADILSAISYPYFNKSGELICNWDKIIPRQEKPEEAQAMDANLEKRKKIGNLLARGVKQRAALNAIMKA